MQDFGERSAAHLRRMKALKAAVDKERAIHRILNLVLACVALVAVASLWSRLEARHLVWLVGGLFVARMVTRFGIRVFWVHPTLERIDREAPKP